MNEELLLIGIDGGATKVSAWEVRISDDRKLFTLGEMNAGKSYREIPGYLPEYKPVDLPTQLREREAQTFNINPDEQQQGTVYVEACASVIEQLVKLSGARQVLVGLGMPGLKTSDRRGIEALANGPRIIHYCNMLEDRLNLTGIKLISPVHHIGSDADYCGIGENYSADGMFRDVATAYYLGGGTGVADALKLNNTLTPFDLTRDWLAKCWEMKSADGRSLERFASAGGIQSIYAEHSGRDVSELNERQIFPVQIAEMAATGDAAAIKTFAMVVENLSKLLLERITTLYSGWQNIFGFVNPNRNLPVPEHAHKGMLLERIIIGQRLGQLYDSPAGEKVLKLPVLEALSGMLKISEVLDHQAKTHYSCIGELIVTSRLREAPAIGAGIDAWLTYHQ
jgi:hypothetical protein